MDGIDKITGRIERDSRDQAEAILAEARSDTDSLRASYEQRAKAETDAILKKGAEAAAQREERLASVAQLEARKLILGAKQEMVGKAFDRALTTLATLPDAEYVTLLAKLAARAARTGREQVVLSQRDRTRFGKLIVTQANEILARQVAPKLPSELTESRAGAFLDKVATVASAVFAGTGMLTLAEESRPMAGGLILKDGSVETNCTFETLIHLQRDTLAFEVAKTLFD